jgi:predicted dithiol-disulfide oxidoreductase (DUF899 family)
MRLAAAHLRAAASFDESMRGGEMSATAEKHNVVSREEWLAARKDFLKKEKEFTRLRDQLSAERRALPWEKVEKNYVFESGDRKLTLGELFGDKSQLVVYHFMLGPGWKEGCPSCSYLADHFNPSVVHLAARDIGFVAVSRAPISEISRFQARMGWRFPWVSSFGSDFNYDYQVTATSDELAKGEAHYNYGVNRFPGEERPGASVFYRDSDGAIYHTYSTYARGLDILIGAYNWMDLAPKGRDEAQIKPHAMAWVRHHDRYAPETGSGCCSHAKA